MRFELLTFYCSISIIFLSLNNLMSQDLSIERIMQNPQWLGSQPSNPQFSADGKKILFRWNPEKEARESMWQYSISSGKPAQKLSYSQGLRELAAASGHRNEKSREIVFISENRLFLRKESSGQETCLLKTQSSIRNPAFLRDGRISFFMDGQPFSLHPQSGSLRQLIHFQKNKQRTDAKNRQDSLLEASEYQLFPTLHRRKEKQDFLRTVSKPNQDSIVRYFTGEKQFSLFPSISPNGKHLAFQLQSASKYTVASVPSYVNSSGYTIEIPTREKVGNPQDFQELLILEIESGKTFSLKSEDLPGIEVQPDFYKFYPNLQKRSGVKRNFFAEEFIWNEDGSLLLADVRSADHKDRWLMLWKAGDQSWLVADHQRDEAWIGGPAAEQGSFGFLSRDEIWFLSEHTGWSGLYRLQANTQQKTAICSGKFEVSDVMYNSGKRIFFFLANMEDAGIHSIYRLNSEAASPEKISAWQGGHQFVVSPDADRIAFRFSTALKPWELFVMESKAGRNPVNITPNATSPEFRSLKLQEPEYIRIKASDGALVPARLYQPATSDKNGAAVIFVHGAGYLQNAHKHWSHYFREFLFHQMLAREGYTVLDLDYRGSAGYGRDWRTGIYRHMGGKDLSDQVDAAGYLSNNLGIDSGRIGIYGGSYGGFITLMALCTKPGKFRCGAALRSVTDWMHYNHGYTSNILNNPLEDSISYRRSSPINFAPGLQGRLLMCHGMQDLNVHYQDIVRFSQRLIELGKENWELASYPIEDHAFTEPESWLDEYRRIYRLFKEELGRKK